MVGLPLLYISITIHLHVVSVPVVFETTLSTGTAQAEEVTQSISGSAYCGHVTTEDSAGPSSGTADTNGLSLLPRKLYKISRYRTTDQFIF